MKFRMLTAEELDELRDDFVKFLIVNGIDAEEWQRLKSDSPHKASDILASFSDFVFTRVVDRIEYLEFLDPTGLKIFKCDEDKIHLIGVDGDKPYTQSESLLEALKSGTSGFKIYRQSKSYKPDRATEIFRMIQSGASASDASWFEILDKLVD